MKFDVLVQFTVSTTITVDAEDFTDAARKVATSNTDWLQQAAADPNVIVDDMTLEIVKEQPEESEPRILRFRTRKVQGGPPAQLEED